MTRNLFLIVLAVTFLFLEACVHKPYYLEPLDTSGLVTSTVDPNASTSVSCDPDTVYFQNQILPVFIGSCTATGCHNSTSRVEGVILVDYDHIMRGITPGNPSRSKYYKVLVTNETEELMPREPGAEGGFRLPDEQIFAIKKWIEQGAKNNFCAECDTADFAFSTRISPILGRSCATAIGCHATGSSYGQFTSYANVKPYIDNGLIYDRVITKQNMPPSGPLLDCDREALRKWIEDGAPTN